MPRDRQELENQLRAKAEAAIGQLVEKLPERSELTMSDMERLIGEMGQAIMRQSLQEVARSEQVEASEVICEDCQVGMHKRGRRKKQVVTKRGEIEMERQYYVCPECGTGVFPPR